MKSRFYHPSQVVEMFVDIRVQAEDFSVADEFLALRRRMSGNTGAVASFAGLVRDAGPAADIHVAEVQTLYLEHYPGMTERSIGDIVKQAAERWPLNDVVVIHRVGELAPLAQIVFVQVASGHRSAAFAACTFIMDYLKTAAIFWKREDTAAGRRWVEVTDEDRERAAAWATKESDR